MASYSFYMVNLAACFGWRCFKLVLIAWTGFGLRYLVGQLIMVTLIRVFARLKLIRLSGCLCGWRCVFLPQTDLQNELSLYAPLQQQGAEIQALFVRLDCQMPQMMPAVLKNPIQSVAHRTVHSVLHAVDHADRQGRVAPCERICDQRQPLTRDLVLVQVDA